MSIRSCEISQQIQYLPGFPDHWRESLEAKLEGDPNIKGWAYILHGQDFNDQGEPVAPHIHGVIDYRESRNVSTIANYFNIPVQCVSFIRQKIKRGKRYFSDIGGALAYLTHRNAPDKHQYDDSEVVSKPGYDWIAVRTKSEMQQAQWKSFQKVLRGIEDGSIRRYNLYDQVTMQLYLDHKTEFENAFTYREGLLKKDPNRQIDVIYITGEAGSGKTTLAKYLCEKRGLSYCVSGSSRDPVQDYNGQDCLILDDLRPKTFDLSDLLKLLDNNTASSVNSRYHDRWLEVQCIIITTVLSIDEFFRLIWDVGEPIAQFKRRCKTLIHLTQNQMNIFLYYKQTQEYMLVGTGANPIADMFQEEDSKEDDAAKVKELCEDLGLEYKPEGLPSDYLD